MPGRHFLQTASMRRKAVSHHLSLLVFAELATCGSLAAPLLVCPRLIQLCGVPCRYEENRRHCDGPSGDAAALTNPTADGKAQLRGRNKVLHRFYCERAQSELDTLQIHATGMVAPLNGKRLALACSAARRMQVQRTPLKALVRVAPVRLARSSSRFGKPHDPSRHARSNNSGNAAAPSNAQRSPGSAERTRLSQTVK